MASNRRRLLYGALAAVGFVAVSCSSSNNAASTTGTTTPATSTPGTATGSGGKKTSAASSDELKKWQTDLNKVGCDAGTVDGIDGGETEAAIRNFQASSGLTVDGQIGAQTEAALTKAASAGTTVCKATPGTSVATTSTTSGAASSSTATSTASTAGPSTTQANGSCPGPNCTDYTASPSSGPAGTTITVHAVSGACTLTGVTGLNPTSPPGPSITQAPLAAQGASQFVGTITVPAGTAPGSYVVQSWSTAAQVNAGLCQAAFTVTG